MANWYDLPKELLISIEQLLTSFDDKIMIRSVCKAWSCSLSNMPKQLPWLFLPYSSHGTLCGLLNPLDNNVYDIEIPTSREKLFLGSSNGWVSVIEVKGDMYAFNPFTKARQNLPHRNTFPDVIDYCVDRPGQEYLLNWLDVTETNFHSLQDMLLYGTHKVVFSSCPTSSGCVAVAMYGCYYNLAYCNIGDDRWSHLYGIKPCCVPLEDVIFHDGKFYAVDRFMNVVVYEVGATLPTFLEVLEKPQLDECYLAVHDGELLLVEQDVGVEEIMVPKQRIVKKTLGFSFYKLDMSGRSWIFTNNLGTDMLFVDGNSSVTVSSLDFPGYKGNRIYYNDDPTLLFQKDNDVDECVCDVDSGDIDPLIRYASDLYRTIYLIPFWVAPNQSFS